MRRRATRVRRCVPIVLGGCAASQAECRNRRDRKRCFHKHKPHQSNHSTLFWLRFPIPIFSEPFLRRSSTRSLTFSVAFALAADFFEQLDLDLLDLKEPVVLLAQQMVDFFVQVTDFQLRFQVHFVIVFSAQAVSRLGPILAHHDDRRLDRGQTGKNEIEKNEWIWIESAVQQENGVQDNPAEEDTDEENDKSPASAE